MTLARALFLLAAAAQSATGAEPSKPQPPVQPPAAQAPVSTPATPTLGRLFFSAEERAAIDDARRRPAVVVAQPAEAKPLPAAPDHVTLNGVVRRSDGSSAIWLNNRMIEGKRTSDGLEVTDSKRAPGPANITIKVPQAGRSVDLRVGQQLDVTSGKVQERYRVVAPEAVTGSGEAAGGDIPSASIKSAPVRRPSRERELRERLRDLEDAQVERQQPPAETKG